MRPYFKKQNHNSKKPWNRSRKGTVMGKEEWKDRDKRGSRDTHVVSVLFSKQEKIIGNEEGTSKRERQLE